MSFLTKIKFGNITNLSDARFAAAAGIEYMGFCFDPLNANYIPPIKAKEIIDWTTGSNIVAEFGSQTLDEIIDISELLNIEVIEINNSILPDELKQLNNAIIKKMDIGIQSAVDIKKQLDAYKNEVDVFHFYTSVDTKNVDTEYIIQLCEEYKIIWGLPIDLSTITQTINTFNPYAINISGGMEEKAGIKDFDELNDLLDLIRVDD
jgi:phosphoribosylanthranilate isomerase